MAALRRSGFAILGACMFGMASAEAETLEIPIGVLKIEYPEKLPLSRLDLSPDDLGFAGGQLSVDDNNTTGRFLGHKYEMRPVSATPEDAAAALDALIEDGVSYVVTMAERDELEMLASHVEGRDILLLNATAKDDALRTEICLANTLHIAPSYAIEADGLAQFLLWKKWRKWLLIHGSHPEDKLWADALRRAARKFGAKIVEEREYEDKGGGRRTDTGHVLVQKQIPIFTQRAKEHDIIIAADEADVFAGFLPYHTWDASLVAGSAGLRPIGWHPATEAWGARQFQRRFERLANRYVRTEDYEVWLAIRVIGEGVTRTNSAAMPEVKAYVLGDDFELGVFKGTKVNFRPWNQQLRTPVLLANDRMLVAVSPQDEFLHKTTRLDTLGFDRPESKCALDTK